VLDKHCKLFLGHKTLEGLPGLALDRWLNLWAAIVPLNTSSKWEEGLEQGSLARQHQLDRAVTKTSNAALVDVLSVLLNGTDSVANSHELNEGILSLGGHTLHDDVDRFVNVVENTRVASKEGDDLSTAGAKGDLQKKSLVKLVE
jgi:hypothetical protein